MSLFANVVLDPASLAVWLCAGLASGWVAGKVLGEPSYGTVGDLILGGGGGLVAGFLCGIVFTSTGFGMAVVASLAGAWACIAAGRMIVAWRGS